MWLWDRWVEVWREPAFRILGWLHKRLLALPPLHRYLPRVNLPLSASSSSILHLSYLLRHRIILSRHIQFGLIVSKRLLEQLLRRLGLVNAHFCPSGGWKLGVDLGVHLWDELSERAFGLLCALLQNELFVGVEPLIQQPAFRLVNLCAILIFNFIVCIFLSNPILLQHLNVILCTVRPHEVVRWRKAAFRMDLTHLIEMWVWWSWGLILWNWLQVLKFLSESASSFCIWNRSSYSLLFFLRATARWLFGCHFNSWVSKAFEASPWL